jgi:hypothetical protein
MAWASNSGLEEREKDVVKSVNTKRLHATLLALPLIALAGAARADVCDYTPSNWAGKTATTIGTAIAAAGPGLKAAGYYTLVHSGSGLTMLGSTAAGASAAGTVGIIAGTAGAIGTVGAILLAPVTIVVGGLTIIGVGAYEGACYFQIERVTDPYQVREIVESVASQDDAVSILSTDDGDAMALQIADNTETYLLRNLYVADGELKHRDYGPNTTLGPILFTSETLDE